MGLGPDPKQNIFYSYLRSYSEQDQVFSTCMSSDGGFVELGSDPRDAKLTPILTSAFKTS